MKIEQGNQSITEYYILKGFPNCSCGAITKCGCNLLKRILEAD